MLYTRGVLKLQFTNVHLHFASCDVDLFSPGLFCVGYLWAADASKPSVSTETSRSASAINTSTLTGDIRPVPPTAWLCWSSSEGEAQSSVSAASDIWCYWWWRGRLLTSSAFSFSLIWYDSFSNTSVHQLCRKKRLLAYAHTEEKLPAMVRTFCNKNVLLWGLRSFIVIRNLTKKSLAVTFCHKNSE